MPFLREWHLVRTATNPQIAAPVEKLRQMGAELKLVFVTQCAQLAFTVHERAVRFELRTNLARGRRLESPRD
jgi:hypothetical protein